MKEKPTYHNYLFALVIIYLVLVTTPRDGGTFSRYKPVYRDTTINNVRTIDTTIYDIRIIDSVVVDYTLTPVTRLDTMTIHDTMFIALPIASYHFADSLADIWASGYRVTLDSVRYHLAERESIIFVESRKRWLTADVGGSLIRFPDVWTLSADVRASARINDMWSVDGRVGIAVGDKVSPYAGVGVRYQLR